ncbi:cbb3-type cytochrome oxidase assembly protein CcoS [Halopseudomonas salegens]|uniref:Cytochrome oxidase maturation protein, cbb3-type n=1 Tax=Halopseudomonas salegens TaxID=1434072 RepID=A0A1H2FVA3_9GAMM|nr:cbb3-type cytochrome oxidase assembly protein CcoS [Halopseudomonas salegens]SDU11255.1 cytochrome oxidase maturation protein, cbb3-type [Halopseudomonas salegens]
MTILYILVPIALLLVIIAVVVFNWAVNTGQYDDLEGPAHSILFDDDDPAHLAAQPEEQTAKEQPSSSQTPAPDAPPAGDNKEHKAG